MQNRQELSRHDDNDSWFLIDSVWGALKRHSLFALVICLPLLAIVAFSLLRWKPEYSATSRIVYDVSKAKETQTESSLVLGNRIAANFSARFADPAFLLNLAERVEPKGIVTPPRKVSKFKETIKSFVPADLRPAAWAAPVDVVDDRMKIEQMGKYLSILTFPTQFTMSVTATAYNPAHAKIIAEEAIRAFVEEDLIKHKAQLTEHLTQLNTMESATLLEKADPKEIASTQAFVREEGVEATEDEKKEVKTVEQSLIAQILLKQKEAVRAQSIQYDREFTLQSELNALLAKRGPAHPEVIQKKIEIEKFKSDGSLTQMEAAITKMKESLYRMQSEMRAKGIPIDRSVQLNSFSDEVRRYLLDISNQIRTTEIEIENTAFQLQDPSRWVRYTLSHAAELPTRPSNLDKLLLGAAVGLALIGLCFLLIVLVRELTYPWIVEAKSLPRRYHLPVLVNVPQADIFLDVDKVRKLRARLGDLRKNSDPELKLLDAYRYLQQILKTKGDPQVICFYDIGSDKVSRHAAFNLANVMATDSNERVIYLSFNPANQKHLPRGEGGNLMNFLSGEIEWKSSRIKATDEIACDIAIAEQPELQLGHFREELVHRLIKALREKYQRVIIDGLNPVFMNENLMIAKESDVILVGTTLGSSKHSDLERLLTVTPKDKVQGFVLG